MIVKSILHSKTFWTNVVALLIAGLSLPSVAELPPEVGQVVAMLLPVLNIILRRLSSGEVRMTTPGKLAMVLLACSLGASTLGCAGVTPPPNLTPAAQKAFQNHQALKTLDLLRDTVVAAEKKQLVKTDTMLQFVKLHRSALKMMEASESGWSAITAQGLKELGTHLPANERALLDPYLKLVSAILEVQ